MSRSPDEGEPPEAATEVSFKQATRLVGGKYRLGKLIGEGAMGAVYEAEHIELGVTVAVKLLSHTIASDHRAVARFRREARATASLKHENIVQVTDAGADEHGPFIIMERLEGESLSSLLHRQRVLEWRSAVGIAKQMLLGLVAAHDHNIVHRDLKPANVLLCGGAGAVKVKLLDFGISKFVREEATAVTTTGEVIGTLRYMAPEQARGQLDVDGRADLYAVGAMLYVMVTGRFPFEGSTSEEVMAGIQAGTFPPPRQLQPDLPEALEQVILKAMALERDDRHADARELLNALRDVSRPPTQEVVTHEAEEAPPPRRRGRATIAVVAAVAAALLALAAGAWVVFGRGAAGSVAGQGPLRLGITRYSSDDAIRKELEPVMAFLHERLGRKVELVIIDYGLDPGAKLLAGDVDIAALPPYVYVRTKARASGLRILATPVSRHGGASYEGVVVARSGSDVHTLEDLKGKVFCYVEETSASGYLYPRALFRRHGLDPDKTFSQVRFKGTHSNTLQALAAGECDGAAVYAAMLDEGERIGLPRDKFVILDATPRIPYDAYCATDKLPHEVANDVEAALLELAPGAELANKLLAHGNFSGFARGADVDYDKVRAIEKFVVEPPPR